MRRHPSYTSAITTLTTTTTATTIKNYLGKE